mmetsp:Transcript_25616/g.18109  ORF Transcript_25616/g.18109 Transcript_25616/m.18109 type:complete len:141 (+) Transcript_25616:65-487(+)
MSYIFTRLTKRQYVYNAENYVDIILFGCVIVWVERFYYYHSHHTSHPFADGETDESNTNFMLNIVVDNETEAFHFDYLLAIIGVMFWLRLFFMLQLTRTLGPLIKIVMAMVRELSSFMVIFMISLTGFTILGMMLFVELD